MKERLALKRADTNPQSSKPSIESRSLRRQLSRTFSVLLSTEMNHRSNDMKFYGPYAHIRKTLDYNYHNNYTKQRQWLQDSIIDEFLDTVELVDVNGDVCTTPSEPWIVFTAGAMGAGKSYTISKLVENGRFPLLAFVSVDPDEVRQRLPEFSTYVKKNPELAGELTRKEAGYVAEILTLAALQAGKNVLVDGSLRDSAWYTGYFTKLRQEYPSVKLSIIHVVAPRDAVFQRAADRAMKTGRVVPKEVLELALDQVPKSVKVLAPLADYFAELNNRPGASDIELLQPEESDWDDFQANWFQTCAFVPGGRKRTFSSRRPTPRLGSIIKPEDYDYDLSVSELPSTQPTFTVDTTVSLASCLQNKGGCRKFEVAKSTETNHMSNTMNFYGPFSHIRSTLDYSYHHNYKKERQWLQDAIIVEYLHNYRDGEDEHGGHSEETKEEETKEEETKEEEIIESDPWIVFTAGVMGAGKRFTVRHLASTERFFPPNTYVTVDPDEIRRHLPEYSLYVDQNPQEIGPCTDKEAGYVAEILILAALQARKNVVVDGSLRDREWYTNYFSRLKEEFSDLKIAILHVVAPQEAILQNAAESALHTGRIVPQKDLDECLEQVPKSVEMLSPMVDFVCTIENNRQQRDLNLMSGDVTWDDFREIWKQTLTKVRKSKVSHLRKSLPKTLRETFVGGA